MSKLGFIYAAAAGTAMVIGIAIAAGSEAVNIRGDIASLRGERFGAVSPADHAALKDCVVCHRVTTDGPERSAPALVGIIGADVAAARWFGYSPALARKEGSWTAETIDRYLADPVGYAPGTFKTLTPIRDASQRKAIIEALGRLGKS